MKFLFIIILSFLGCKTVSQNDNILKETEAFIFTFSKNDIYLIPVENYNTKETLEANLKDLVYKNGHKLNYLTQSDYEVILKESISFRRADIPNDFADYSKTINILAVNIKYRELLESNNNLYKENKKFDRNKIILENNIEINLKYNYLKIKIIEMDLL